MKKFFFLLVLFPLFAACNKEPNSILRIQTEEGAEIYIDGEFKVEHSEGVSTLNVVEGEREVLLIRKGDEPYEFYVAQDKVRLGANVVTKKTYDLNRTFGELEDGRFSARAVVYTSNWEGKLKLDDAEPKAMEPQESMIVPAGEHRAVLLRERDGEVQIAQVDFEAQKGRIVRPKTHYQQVHGAKPGTEIFDPARFETQIAPHGADLYIDGQRIGQTPYKGLIVPGKHHVEARKEHHISDGGTLEFNPGEMHYPNSVLRLTDERKKWLIRRFARNRKKADRLNDDLGVPAGRRKNYKRAVRYYRQAAELGNWIAAGNLSGLYTEGRGVPKSLEQALYWSRRAIVAKPVKGRHHNELFAWRLNNTAWYLTQWSTAGPDDYQEALDLALRATKVLKHSYTWGTLAEVYVKRAQWEKAKQANDKSLKLDPKNDLSLKRQKLISQKLLKN